MEKLAPEKRDATRRAEQLSDYAQPFFRVLIARPELFDDFITAETAQTPKGKAPPHEAWTLAYEQADQQLAVAAADCKAMGLTTLMAGGNRREWPIEQPSSLNVGFARLGLPLVGSLIPSAGEYLATLRSALALRQHSGGKPTDIPSFSAARADLAACISDFLITERVLWAQATIPYAFRWAALTTIWLPVAHTAQRVPTLCLRCGDIHDRQRAVDHVPLCDHCAKNIGASLHTWPDHAIAPAGRGTWWLHCQEPDCNTVFRAQRQARKCAGHKANRITPANRPTTTTTAKH